MLDGLKKERLERGWSIHRMAQELDMDRGYLYRIESGAVSLGLKNLIALCDKMGAYRETGNGFGFRKGDGTLKRKGGSYD